MNRARRGTHARWKKSSYSSDSGNCVETAMVRWDRVGVRDSKDPEGPRLAFPVATWREFVRGIRAGEFNPMQGS
jgi:hypothetical protein